MNVLYITTIASTMNFFKSMIRTLIDDGNIVDIACNDKSSKIPDCYHQWGCKVYPISCERYPFSSGNIKAISQIRKIVSAGYYNIVHCHTPIAAMCTRVACRKVRKQGTKVIYTAHGFHFYKGALLKNWLIFCTVERVCAKWTDVLITINKEDYAWAKEHLKIKQIEYVPGVGIDTVSANDKMQEKAGQKM